jgi:hypothetical protein
MKKHMALGLILMILFTTVLGCTQQTMPVTTAPVSTTQVTNEIPSSPNEETGAKPYLVLSEGNLANEDISRSVGLWFITSAESSSFEEYALTATRAVLDLYYYYRRDFTSVLLVPEDGVRIPYAQANFAADGRGAAGMTGSAPAKEMYWKIWATIDPPLSEQELNIARLWAEKERDFPSRNPLSSLSYDSEALRQYISETLGIPYDEVQMPDLEMREYFLDESFTSQTMSLPGQIPDNPSQELALTALLEDHSLDESDQAVIDSLVNEISGVTI